jgi:DNA-binding NarL/FixJ family response regulator
VDEAAPVDDGRIDVVVVDDHALVRSGLRALIDAAPDMRVVGEAPDGAVAADLVAAACPDVVLMDLSMPRMDGVSATRAVLERCPGTAVIVLTSFVDRERVGAAIAAGAVGYLLKDGVPREVVDGVRAAARGESPLDPKAARLLIQNRAAERPGPALTDREREVLTLLAEGLANKQIARRLGITERTVKAHLTRIYAALGVSDRTAAALWLQRNA